MFGGPVGLSASLPTPSQFFDNFHQRSSDYRWQFLPIQWHFLMSDWLPLASKLLATPPFFVDIFQALIFPPSYDLKDGKKSTVRARLRAGGERPSGGWRPPALGTGCGVFGGLPLAGPLRPRQRFEGGQRGERQPC